MSNFKATHLHQTVECLNTDILTVYYAFNSCPKVIVALLLPLKTHKAKYIFT